MKHIYVKPTILIEHYALSQSIASCQTKIGFQNSNCVLEDPDATEQMKDLAYYGYFNEGHCNWPPIGMGENDKICYHANANAAFTS